MDFFRDAAGFCVKHPVYFAEWLKMRLFPAKTYPDVRSTPEWKTFRDSMPGIVQTWLDEKWAKDQPKGSVLRPMHRDDRYKTDVIYTGTLKADAHKDLIALRKTRPDLHMTALYIWPDISRSRSFAFDIADRVIFLRTQAELVEFLLNADAQALVFQGGDDQVALLNCCIYPGRFVWQVRDTSLRTPKEYLPALPFERAKYIAERADGIISFHHESGWHELERREGIHYRSAPVCIPPACVPEIDPPYRLKKLSASDGALHIIYAGGVGPVGGSPYETIVYTHADFYQKFKTIVEQGIHLHVYSPHTDKGPRPGYQEYFDLQKNSPYFHIEKSIPFADLLLEYTKYDWAIMHVTWQPEYLIPGFDRPIQNGLMGAVQARVPIIVSPTALGNAAFAHTSRRGVVIDERDIGNIRIILEENDAMRDECVNTPLEPELQYSSDAFARAVLGE